jgi:predicted transcriptional regulator
LPSFGYFFGQIGPDMGGFCPKKLPKNGLAGLGLERVVSRVVSSGMAMTLRLTDDEAAALRARADAEGRSMQEVARAAIATYVSERNRRDLIEGALTNEVPRYAEALRRLGE